MDFNLLDSPPTDISSVSRQLPSFRRSEKPPPFRLTRRDQQIILRVAAYKLLSTHHIEAMLFHRRGNRRTLKTQCQRRLQLLYHHRFLNRIQRPVVLGEGQKPFIYILDTLGAKAASQLLDNTDTKLHAVNKHKTRLSAYTLEHDLAVSTMWVVLEQLIQQQVLKKPYWMPQHVLKSLKHRERLPSFTIRGQKRAKVPDGYFALQFPQVPDLAHFFFEQDCGTESCKQWTEKVRAYINFRHSGASGTYFNCHNFRVLIVTTTNRRLANLKRWTELAGGDAMFWFTTQEQICMWEPKNLLNAIWTVPTANGAHSLLVTDTSQL